MIPYYRANSSSCSVHSDMSQLYKANSLQVASYQIQSDTYQRHSWCNSVSALFQFQSDIYQVSRACTFPHFACLFLSGTSPLRMQCSRSCSACPIPSDMCLQCMLSSWPSSRQSGTSLPRKAHSPRPRSSSLSVARCYHPTPGAVGACCALRAFCLVCGAGACPI